MLSIVIVDDARDDSLVAQRVFAQCKIQNPTVILDGGADAIQYFRGAEPFQDRVLPCLLLLDMVMSPVSGLDVLEELPKIEDSTDSVVVMLSGLTDLKMINQGYQLGADTFLVKPLLREDLMQMLNAIPKLAVERRSHGYEILLAPSTESAGQGYRGRGLAR